MFTPAAIAIEANVCRHSYGVTRASPALVQAASARRWSRFGQYGDTAVAPNARSGPRRRVFDASARRDAEAVSVGQQRGQGHTSGLPATRALAGVWTIRDAKIVRAVWFPTREEALEAVGLSE
jgi:hypothetical protein